MYKEVYYMYYDTSAVAKLLDITVDTVRRKIRKGELTSIKINGQYKVPMSEVNTYLLKTVEADVSDEEKKSIVLPCRLRTAFFKPI